MHDAIVDAIVDLQHEVGFGNAEKGFHDQGIMILSDYATAQKYKADPEASPFIDPAKAAAYITEVERDYAAYCAQRLLLVVTEISEAFEEIRSGRSMTEVWYSHKTSPGQIFTLGEDGVYTDQNGEQTTQILKPEGVPSELADILIRVLDIGDEFGINLGAVVQEKLAHNATREKMHGRKL